MPPHLPYLAEHCGLAGYAKSGVLRAFALCALDLYYYKEEVEYFYV